MLWVFCLCFELSDASSERANDRLRVSKACPEWFSEFIHPRYSKSGLKGFHVAPFGSSFVVLGFVVVRIRSLSVVLTAILAASRGQKQNRHLPYHQFLFERYKVHRKPLRPRALDESGLDIGHDIQEPGYSDLLFHGYGCECELLSCHGTTEERL